jgi:hypothetical protein
MKICPKGVELFHEHGHTVLTKLVLAFCNSANVPNEYQIDYKFNTT